MFASAGKALGLAFDSAFFWVMLKSFGLAILVFAGLYVAIDQSFALLESLGWKWLDWLLAVLAPVLTILLFVFLGAPTAAIFAGLFVDEIAEKVEAKHYPQDPKSPGVPFLTGLGAGLRLAAVIIGLNLLMLPLHFVLPGLGTLIAIVVNGYLLGREYFELVALRHHPLETVRAKRRRRAGRLFLAGLFIALLAAIPFVNFAAPLFGAAFMVHLYKSFEREEHPA